MYTDELANASTEGMRKLWTGMLADDKKSTEAFHGIQKGLHCCGLQGPADWTTNNRAVPSSCCAEDSNSCTQTTAFANGCEKLVFDIVRGSGLLIAYIAVAFAAFEVKL